MSMYGKLVNGEVVLVDDLLEWARWFENFENRRIAETLVGDIRISTVFLGINHQWNYRGRPLWFETMIFGGEHDEYQERYSTLEEAMLGHEHAVGMVQTERK